MGLKFVTLECNEIKKKKKNNNSSYFKFILINVNFASRFSVL